MVPMYKFYMSNPCKSVRHTEHVQYLILLSAIILCLFVLIYEIYNVIHIKIHSQFILNGVLTYKIYFFFIIVTTTGDFNYQVLL